MDQKKAWTLSLCLMGVCILVALWGNQAVGKDAASFYIPMGECLAEGNFERAFNPGIPPLVPLLGGVATWCVGGDGFLGLKIVTALFILLGLLPLVSLTRRVVDEAYVPWVCILYAVCSQVIRFGITPQLTAAKFCLMLWLLERCVAVSERVTWGRLINLAVSMALLALCRTEGVAWLVFGGIAVALGTWRSWPNKRAIRVLGGWGVLVAACLVVWGSWLYYEYQTCGYPLLDQRQRVVFEIMDRVIGRTGPATPAPVATDQSKASPAVRQGIGEKFEETLDGLYIPYLPLVLLGGWCLRRKRPRRGADLWLWGAALFNVLVIWWAANHGSPVLKRYIFPSALFLMPYAAQGWGEIWTWAGDARRQRLRGIVTLVAVIVGVVSVGDGMKQVIDTARGKYHMLHEVGAWMRAHQAELDHNGRPSDERMLALSKHWTGRSLLVATPLPFTSCWARAQWVCVDRRVEWRMEEVLAFCRDVGVDVIQVDRFLLGCTSDFDPNDPSLTRLDTPWSGGDIVLYRLD